ncbi:MAG TPA: hypothetical protein VNW97_15315 [Candidatus Saccharimonadales bacterium]|jgi:hypothetical protein|nr:hypothetical protein [Candidatus Saccharimonadales bacterium]
MTKTDILLFLATPALEVCLAVILVQRRLYREFPLFFAYITSSIVIGLGRYSASNNYPTYFGVYWATAVIDSLLALLVLYEVFHWVFLEYYSHWKWFWLIFPGVVAMVLLLSLGYAVVHPPVQANRVISLVLVFGFAVNFIEIGLFLLFFGLVRLFSLSWWSYSFSIVMGFAVAATGAAGAYWLRSDFGTKFNTLVTYAPPVSYILAVLLWLSVFRRPEPEANWTLSIGPEAMLNEVMGYRELIKKVRERLK